jgi:hypothetical protein
LSAALLSIAACLPAESEDADAESAKVEPDEGEAGAGDETGEIVDMSGNTLIPEDVQPE